MDVLVRTRGSRYFEWDHGCFRCVNAWCWCWVRVRWGQVMGGCGCARDVGSRAVAEDNLKSVHLGVVSISRGCFGPLDIHCMFSSPRTG